MKVKGKKFLAYIMMVFMLISTLPASVFASEALTELGGELQIKGELIVGQTLKAKYEKVTPENLTDEDVDFQWSRISEEDFTWLKEHEDEKDSLNFPDLGKGKEYTVSESDEGFHIILAITAKEDHGITGMLTFISKDVIAPVPEEEEEELWDSEELPEMEISEEEYEEEIPEANDDVYEEIPEDVFGEESDSDESWEEEWDIPFGVEEVYDENSGEMIPEETELEPIDEEVEEPVEQPQEEPIESPEEGFEPEETIPFTITDCVDSIDFGVLQAGYGEDDYLSQSVEAAYESGEDKQISIGVKEDAQYFTVVYNEEAILPAGEGTFSFRVDPVSDLPAGTYESEIGIFSGEDEIYSIPVKVEVAEPIFKLEADTSEIMFHDAEEGYTGIKPQTILLFNHGNQPIDIWTDGNEYFAVEGAEDVVIQPGESAEISVSPRTGLERGIYTQNIDIVGSGDVKVTVNVSFKVTEKKASEVKLLSIHAPKNITDLANGTAKDAQSMKLPSYVKIETTNGQMKAKVSWDLKNCAYNPAVSEAQNFTVNGQVKLPDGVVNTDNISLAVSVNVSVRGYQPTLASADRNQINGISGPYTTASRISFTAVGAGMDNQNPKTGDTRFVPESWSVVNSYKWEKSPYTASFGMAKAGDYNLSVRFRQQKYNGTAWADTEVYDTKSVPFKVTQAVVSPTSVPGQTLTPAAKKPAVNTGDNNPIVLLIVVMAAAAAVIAGVFVYRSKKK